MSRKDGVLALLVVVVWGLNDVVLLGPQVRFQKPEIEAVAQGKMPVAVIEMKDYGTMNGQAVLEFAMKLLQE
ncbi:hypothetical protein F9539_15105 [Escherichia coli]|nr:hypothetical protein [Escherichia coli]